MNELEPIECFRCPVCNKLFSTRDKCDHHLKNNHDNPLVILSLRFCADSQKAWRCEREACQFVPHDGTINSISFAMAGNEFIWRTITYNDQAVDACLKLIQRASQYIDGVKSELMDYKTEIECLKKQEERDESNM